MKFEYNQKIKIPKTKSIGRTKIETVSKVIRRRGDGSLYFKRTRVNDDGVKEYHFMLAPNDDNGFTFYFLAKDLVANKNGW